MELLHEFVVPVGVDQAWDVLLDLERVGPCMPGATLDSVTGDEFTGKVKVKVGPIQVTYNGTGRFTSKDAGARTAVIEASGKEARGSGTAKATITARMLDDGPSSTKVSVTTDLAVTGRPAQFGRGVMVEVGNKLLGQFADCLADTLGETTPGAGGSAGAPVVDDEGPTPAAMVAPTSPPPPEAEAPGQPTESIASSGVAGTAPMSSAASAASGTTPRGGSTAPPRPTSDTIDLIDLAGPSVAKRLLPVAAALALLLLFWAVLRSRRS